MCTKKLANSTAWRSRPPSASFVDGSADGISCTSSRGTPSSSACVISAAKPEAVLACQDRMVRVIKGNDLHYEAPMAGPVLTVERYANTSAAHGSQAGGFGALDPQQPA